jgi:hypothetical protein
MTCRLRPGEVCGMCVEDYREEENFTMGDRCATGPRPKAVWETDNHEPEGEVPIGGREDEGEVPGTNGGEVQWPPPDEVRLRETVPQGLGHLAELAAQLGVAPGQKANALCMLGTDEKYYDVFELGLRLLAKLRELPKLPDVVRQLDHTTDEAIRRQGEIDKANAEIGQLQTQLGGCLLAAEGGTSEPQRAHPGDYGWSKAYQAVLDLRLRYEELLEELERRNMGDAAVAVAVENRLDASREAMSKGAKVVLAALDSGSATCRAAAEKLIREDDRWYVMVELHRLAQSRECPRCGLSRSSDCCNEECKGEWGTGCYHCHYPLFMEWGEACKRLLARRGKRPEG